jgi:hypothetical protein
VIELHRESATDSDRLVLDISTSPGMPPNLESFTLGRGDTLLKVAPFGESNLSDLMVKNVDGRWITVSLPERQDFFVFAKGDSTVRVSFLPAALQLMGRECTISWIDWYRR